MNIVKYYTCPIYKTTKCKIFMINSDYTVNQESDKFDLQHLNDRMRLYGVDKALHIHVAKSKQLNTISDGV